jgi:hypothetical protein
LTGTVFSCRFCFSQSGRSLNSSRVERLQIGPVFVYLTTLSVGKQSHSEVSELETLEEK